MTNTYFCIFISFLIIQRISELIIARSNEKWLLLNGAIEYGKKHYPVMVMLHTFFIASLIFEYILRMPDIFSSLFLFIFILLIALKFWVITSLGKFWNTKIYRAPNFPLVAKGPYKYIKHPNYFIVIGEIAVIPLIFGLYYTAVIFSLLNAAMLYVRIKEENKALSV